MATVVRQECGYGFWGRISIFVDRRGFVWGFVSHAIPGTSQLDYPAFRNGKTETVYVILNPPDGVVEGLVDGEAWVHAD